jgi:ABC-type dipeptide/oligopeptide/nickel transport system permease component
MLLAEIELSCSEVEHKKGTGMKPNKRLVKSISIICLIGLFLLMLGIKEANDSFDETKLDVDNIYRHMEELSSEEYFGRLAGSAGNRKALDYVASYFEKIGVEPAGLEDSYFQPFSTIIPDIDTDPSFSITSGENGIVQEFTMYEDYNIIPSMGGGSIDYSGEIILVGSNLLRIEPSLIKGRLVVVEAGRMRRDRIDYVIQNGGEGIFFCTDVNQYGGPEENEVIKSLDMAGKPGEPILVGYLSWPTYHDMLELVDGQELSKENKYIGIIEKTHIKVAMGFPIVDTANILGKIEAKDTGDRVLLITADLDGTGAGTGGRYFPGAISNTSGMATLLEAARVIANQENLPYRTIVFIGFNAQEQGLAGSDYYIRNPIYDLDKTTIIHLKALGEKSWEGLRISSDNFDNLIFKEKIGDYATDMGIRVVLGRSTYGAISHFSDKRISSVMLSDIPWKRNSYQDTMEHVDMDTLGNSSQVLLSYVKRDIFKDTGIDYLDLRDKLFIGLLFLGLVISSGLSRLYKTSPNFTIVRSSVEDLYFSNAMTLLRKIYTYGLLVFGALFLLVYLVNISPESDLQVVNQQWISNFSGYLNLKHTLLYFKGLLHPTADTLDRASDILKVVYKSSYRSMALISGSLLLSTILGIARGIYEGYESKKRNLRSLSTLILFSIPDVLIVLVGLLAYVFIAKRFPEVNALLAPKEFLLPLITLSILPTIYISRITYMTILDETKKDYVMNARAKGLSKKKIFASEMMPAILFKIVDTLPTIMTMLLSNLIVVEYLFNYIGIVYYLVYFYKSMNVDSFVALALTLGAIYLLFTGGFHLIAKAINPLKREVEK